MEVKAIDLRVQADTLQETRFVQKCIFHIVNVS